MGRLPIGLVSDAVRGSSGGSCDRLNLYSTSYNCSHGQPEFVPYGGKRPGIFTHRKTGYQSNFRPPVYYSHNIDRRDNPSLGLMLGKNYTSITNRDYVPYQQETGAEPLPHTVYAHQSGFIRSNKITNAKSRAVKSNYFDTRDHGAEIIAGLQPYHRPILFQPLGKGSPYDENLQHGPAFMSTEYKTKYSAKSPHDQTVVGSRNTVIGPMEDSGFTEGASTEPITHDPPSQQRVPKGYHRLMGHSLTKTDFLPSSMMEGREPLPVLAKNSERDSSFTREAAHVPHTSALSDASRPAPYLKQNDALLGRVSVGKKESSGFNHNNKKYVKSEKELPQYYLTTYNKRFIDPAPHGRDREGWTRFGIQNQLHSGYTLNNELHINI